MALSDTTIANNTTLGTPTGKKSQLLLHQRPRAAANVKMHSILGAVVGLKRLGAPDNSPGKSSPRPIKKPSISIEATKVHEATSRHGQARIGQTRVPQVSS